MKKILCLLVALSFLLAACGTTTSSSTPPVSSVSQVQADNVQIPINIEDKYMQPHQTSLITLSGTTAEYNGENGVSISGSTITITKPAVYTISGQLENGQIIVDTSEKGTVTLVLNNVNITNAESASIWVKQASETVVAVANDSINTLSSGADASTADENAAKGAIFASDDLWLCGNGTLNINAEKGNGIQGKDTLTIASGSYTIDAGNNGIVGKDSLLLGGGEYNITAGNDGVKSTNDTDTALGTITVLSGNFNITANGDGFQAQTALNISGGEFDIITGGGAENAAQKTQNEMFGKGGGGFAGGTPPQRGQAPSGEEPPQQTAPTQQATASALAVTTTTDATTAETDSFKAFKASTALNISGGSFNINSCDDAFHSNDSLIVTKGQFEVSTGDDAFHADNSLAISGGTINVTKSYEGIEATEIVISGGEISVVSSDDGINAAGGDGSGQYGFAEDGFKSGASSGTLTISGGNITVNAEGDGIDINGSGEMTGGTVTVYGPQNGGNGALDYDGEFVVKGGSLLSFGSAQMALTPTTSGCALIAVGGSLSAGQTVQFKASSGATAEFTTLKEAQQILFASPDFKSGDTVTVYLNGVSAGEATLTNGVSTIGTTTGMGGGMGGNKPQRGTR